MAQIISDSQQIQLTAKFVDKKGNAAVVDGAPTWGSSDETILTVAPGLLQDDGTILPDDTGFNAVAKAVGPLGTAQANVHGDADLGAGVEDVIGVFDIEIAAGRAISAGITAGTPVEQPTP